MGGTDFLLFVVVVKLLCRCLMLMHNLRKAWSVLRWKPQQKWVQLRKVHCNLFHPVPVTEESFLVAHICQEGMLIYSNLTPHAWHQLLWAHNCPLPHERKTTSVASTSSTLFVQQCGFFQVSFQLIRKDEGDKSNGITSLLNDAIIWTDTRS